MSARPHEIAPIPCPAATVTVTTMAARQRSPARRRSGLSAPLAPVLSAVLAALSLPGCGTDSDRPETADEARLPLEQEADLAERDSALTGTWASLGVGVSYRATGAGSNVFIGYAGYNIGDDQAKAWVDALYAARLGRLQIGGLYAVRGPADVTYSRREIGNTKLIAHLLPRVGGSTKLVVIASHSSGSYVANEFFGFVYDGTLDPGGRLLDKTVYYNLDGAGGLSRTAVNKLYRTFFVHAQDSRGGKSPNATTMVNLAYSFVPRAGSVAVSGDGSGCNVPAPWCLHMVLVNARPHNPAGTDGRDYSDFAGRPVQTSALDQTWPLLAGLAARP